MTTVQTLMDQFEDFHQATIEARDASERDVDYENSYQWTDAELEVLDSRRQAAIVVNRIKKKVNTLTGLQRKSRTQPKALPRNAPDEDAANAATEGLRYVRQNNNFEVCSSAVFRDQVLPGYGGAIVEVEDRNGEIEIKINQIPWNRYYYDPHSSKLDFSDKNFDGIVLWMDKEDAKLLFPGKEDSIDERFNDSTSDDGSETFEDKPIYYDRKSKRVRIFQHFFKSKGVWKMAYFMGNEFLIEPKDSPYLDEFGKPVNPIEAQGVYMDRELNRYGEIRSFIDLQDEINHRRTKFLYEGSVNQVIMERGAVEDETALKQELAKADGVIIVNPGRRFDIVPRNIESEVQLLLYKESKFELDEAGPSALGGNSSADSGRGMQVEQQSEAVPLTPLFDGHRQWETRIDRQIWNRIRQFWNAEKWIRITDDESNLQWVGLNIPVTNGELLLKAANEGSQEAAAMLQQMMLNGDPRLNEIAEVKNETRELDIDIILKTAPDYATLRQEQFDTLGRIAERFAPHTDINMFQVMVKLSELPNKDEVAGLLEPQVDPEQQQMQEAVGMKQLDQQLTKGDLDIAEQQVDIQNKQVDGEQKQIETIKLIQEPIQSVNVNV